MKTYKFVFAAIIAMLALASIACNFVTDVFDNAINGSGNRITEERPVAGFDRVSLTGFGTLNIEQGEEESLTVRTDDNIMPYIETEVRNDTLVLGFTDRRSYNPTDGVEFNLVVKDLSRLDFTGAGTVHAGALEVDRLHINLSGAGSLDFTGLTADELVLQMSGAGSVVMAGKVKGQDVTLSGAASYDAADLESETAIIEMSGIGSITLWVTETLDVELSSLGNVQYYGSPRVIQDVSGLGKVSSLGEK